MRWISPIVALAGLLVGGGALPPVDCGSSTPAPRGVASSLEPVGLISVGGFGLSGTHSTIGSSIGASVARPMVAAPNAAAGRPCGVAAEPVGIVSGTLRNETADVLHGLEPADDLHSPVDDSRAGYR
jgi:hypothetical protein